MCLENRHARGIIEINGPHHFSICRERGLAFLGAANRRRFAPGFTLDQIKNDGCILVELLPQLCITAGASSPLQRLSHRDMSQTIDGTSNASGFLFRRRRRHLRLFDFTHEDSFIEAVRTDKEILPDTRNKAKGNPSPNRAPQTIELTPLLEDEVLEDIWKRLWAKGTTPLAAMSDMAINVGLLAINPVRTPVLHAFIHGVYPVFS